MSVSKQVNPFSEGESAAAKEIASSSDGASSLGNGSGSGGDASLDHESGGGGAAVDGSEPNTSKPVPTAFTVDFGDAKKVDKSRLEELAKKSQARHQRVHSMSGSFTRSSAAAQKPSLSGALPRKAHGYHSEGYFSSDQEDSTLSGSVKLRNSPLALNMAMSTPKNIVSHSPITDLQPRRTSKSPIVDSIMSRSDNFTGSALRHGLNLPLKYSNGSYLRDIQRTPSYSNLNFYPRTMENIIDNSPDGVMLADISTSELDMLTPDHLATPDRRSVRAVSVGCDTPDLLALQPGPDDDDQLSTSSAGTYTIESHHCSADTPALDRPHHTDNALTLNTTFDVTTYDALNQTYRLPNDKNVLEISCCYESPTDDLASQTSKQIKSTRNYLEKIKSRVRTITEKTFSKTPQASALEDVGSVTSVTTSGVLNGRGAWSTPPLRRSSRQPVHMHHLSRESSVPVNLPGDHHRLSHLSVNRCKGDNTWIQDWAESVKKYNTLGGAFKADERSAAPAVNRVLATPRARTPVGDCSGGRSPCKAPGTLRRRTPDLIPSQEPEAYLLNTQNAISSLQAKLQAHREAALPSAEAALPSRLPVAQLSRSNSLNYRLRMQEASPLRSPLGAPPPPPVRDLNYNVSRTMPRSSSCQLVNNNPSLSDESDAEYERSKQRGRQVPTLSPRRASRAGRQPQPICPLTVVKAQCTDWKRPHTAARRDLLDDLSSPSHSSSAGASHSSRTWRGGPSVECSTEGSGDELPPPNDVMLLSTHSDTLHLRPRARALSTGQPPQPRAPPPTRSQQRAPQQPRDRAKQRTSVTNRGGAVGSAPSRALQVTSRGHQAPGSDHINGTSSSSGRASGPRPRDSAAEAQSQSQGRRAASAPTYNRRSVGGPPGAAPGVQPRYMDISRHRAPPAAAASQPAGAPPRATKGSAMHIEMEQKKQELAKWRRRATYDPRAAARATPRPANSERRSVGGGAVQRSQSYHGPLLAPGRGPAPQPRGPGPHSRRSLHATDAGSDNDF